MEMGCRINSSSKRATWETSTDLCRTFGALFRDDLETLGWHPMLIYTAPLVLKKISLHNISYLFFRQNQLFSRIPFLR